MKANNYEGLTIENCSVIVEKNEDLPSYPYTIRRMGQWGLSDGTLSTSNHIANNPEYVLTEQIGGSNIYVRKDSIKEPIIYNL